MSTYGGRANLRFKILDGLTVEHEGQALDLGPPKTRLLLAVLLCRLGEPVTVSELVDALWNDQPPTSAGENLRGYVHQLRKTLGRALVIRRGATYSLVLEAHTLDANEFDARVAQADAMVARGDLDAARSLFHRAFALWHSRPFGVLCEEPSLAKYVVRLEGQRLAALERRYDVELKLGGPSDLVVDLTVLASEHPFRERLHGQLMLALNHSGRQADALKVYRDLRATLVRELGIEPGRELTELHEAILRNEPALSRPLVGASGPRPPAELPQALRHFSGRSDELKRLDELATESDGPASPVITVVGSPGVGKTALVVQWAHGMGARFPDGLIFVDLRGFGWERPMPPSEAIGHLLISLGVAATAVPPSFVDAVALYRSTIFGRRVLVVLDNARSAAQVRELLPGGATALAVVTSRNRLTGLIAGHGARSLALQPLTTADALGLLSRVLDDGRVGDEPAAAADLVEACDRLPLAVCITAANLAEDPARDIATHLAELRVDRLAALEVDGDRDFRLTAAFDQSYDSLDARERSAFRLLGALPCRDFTPSAIAAALDSTVEESKRQLGRLARAHLVEARGGGRYVPHDLLREYARGRAVTADPDEVQAAFSRLCAYYLRLCDSAARLMYPQLLRLPYPPDAARDAEARPVAEAVAWLNEELGNLVAVCLHASGAGSHPAGWQLADLLRGYFWGRGFADQWHAVATAAATAAAERGDLRAQAMAELSLGNYFQRRRETPEALARYAEVLRLSRVASWPEAEACGESAMGSLYFATGELERAVRHLGTSLAITRRIGAQPASDLYNLMAGAMFNLGRLDAAYEYLQAMLALFHDQGARTGEALARGNLALVLCLQGSLGDALEQATESLRMAEELDEPTLSTVARIAVASVGNEAGDPGLARRHAERALELSVAVGDVGGECQAHHALGLAYRTLGRIPDAITRHEAALRLARQISDGYVEIESMTGLAAAYLALGEPERALASGGSAVARAREVGYRALLARALAVLSRVYRRMGKHADSDEAMREAIDLQSETGCRLPRPT